LVKLVALHAMLATAVPAGEWEVAVAALPAGVAVQLVAPSCLQRVFVLQAHPTAAPVARTIARTAV
jgi:hypothetical protein